jgi:hypothetical protein
MGISQMRMLPNRSFFGNIDRGLLLILAVHSEDKSDSWSDDESSTSALLAICFMNDDRTSILDEHGAVVMVAISKVMMLTKRKILKLVVEEFLKTDYVYNKIGSFLLVDKSERTIDLLGTTGRKVITASLISWRTFTVSDEAYFFLTIRNNFSSFDIAVRFNGFATKVRGFLLTVSVF